MKKKWGYNLRLKQVLEKYGLSQKDLAQMLGLTESAVSRIVSGEIELRIKHAKVIGDRLGFDWKQLYPDK
ncbi:MAG: helix-turn-helix transcriptional regulator [Christensenellales bacterium]